MEPTDRTSLLKTAFGALGVSLAILRAMKKILLILICSFLLAGCDARQPQSASSLGFTVGASKDEVLRQLKQSHARVLTNTPDLILAELKSADVFIRPSALFKKPMQVELILREGKVADVTYIPQ